jgi:hypothetical protein
MKQWLGLLFAASLFTTPAMAQEVPREKVKEILEKFVNEPTVQEIQAWTVDYAKVGADVIKGMFLRVKLSQFLPRFQAQVDRNLERDESLDQQAGAADQFGIDTDNDIRFRFRGDWQMSQWLFNPLELRVAAEAGDIAQLREDLLTAVTKVYFERRRLQIELVLEPPTDLAVAVKKELRLQELTATLDAYTGSKFSDELRKARK